MQSGSTQQHAQDATAPEALSFEDAMRELESIVQSLESGKGDLEASIRLYERGAALRTHCERKLQEAQLRVEQITRAADGTTEARPFADATT